MMLKMIGVGDNVIDKYIYQGMVYPGGNSVNFAVFGRMLGHETAYAGVFGSDAAAALVEGALKRMGVDVSRCEHKKGETGVSATYLTDGDRTITEENEGGVVRTDPFLVTGEVERYLESFDVIHTSCLSYLDDQLEKLKAAGKLLVYDFSDIWDEERLKSVCPHIQVAFLSGKGLEAEKLKETLKLAVGLGCRLAAATMGSEGACVYDGMEFYRSSPYNMGEPVIDTLGAGDSFLTAWISAYAQGMKQYENFCEAEGKACADSRDERRFKHSLMEYAMNLGSLFARRNCMVPAAFGMGVPIDELQDKTEGRKKE